jgi:ectoine hydroxylase-related dioxygenase (phytanoyl-CoA dioxygenase family)
MIDDLSNYHHRITEIFRKPATVEEWSALKLNSEEIEFYRKYGYLAGIRVLSTEQVMKLKLELADLMEPGHEKKSLFYEYHSNESRDPSTNLFHALGAWRISSAFHDLLWNSSFTVPASQLLEGPVRFWHDQLFCKPPMNGGVVAWHQDYSYWTRTVPMAHLSCWVGLDDSTRSNGCVHYVPGSHKWNLLPITGLAGTMDAIQSVLTDQQKAEFRPVAIELKEGEASFHHPLMVHGSYENSSKLPRRAAVINVFRDGVKSASDDPPLEGVPPILSGQPMTGRFFPLLFDPDEMESGSDR